MIDEAIGKILGMAMAYVASAAGMFVAYVNYRKRIVKADKIMTPAAWTVILSSVVAVGGAVLLVGQLAGDQAVGSAAPAVAEVAEVPAAVAPEPPSPESAPAPDRAAWPWVGIIVPGFIFLLATWITAALHRHFSTHGHGPGH